MLTVLIRHSPLSHTQCSAWSSRSLLRLKATVLKTGATLKVELGEKGKAAVLAHVGSILTWTE